MVAVFVAALCALAVPFAVADPALTGYPNSIAATGDSITRAFNTCSSAFIDCPANAWSTGTSSTRQQPLPAHPRREPAISGRNYNDAKTGGEDGRPRAPGADRRSRSERGVRDDPHGRERRLHVERVDDDAGRDASLAAPDAR